jgi:DNA-binding CsgD family transcriptional regulator
LLIEYDNREKFNILWANQRLSVWYKEYTGGVEMEAQPQSLQGFFLEEDLNMFALAFDYFDENRGKAFRKLYHRIGERNLWIFINSVVVEPTEDGRPGKIIVMLTDLTREIESEVSLHRILEQNSRVRKKYRDMKLTPREREVLQLISRGRTNKQIASDLNISLHTVDSHRKHLLAKFDVNNTAALVRISLELAFDFEYSGEFLRQ